MGLQPIQEASGQPANSRNLATSAKRLYTSLTASSVQVHSDFKRDPITLITYAACIGARLSKDFLFIKSLISTKLKKEYDFEIKAIDIVPPFLMLQLIDSAKELEGMNRMHAPLNDWLHDTLLSFIGDRFSSSDEFTLAFDRLEILLALAYKIHTTNHSTLSNWFPPGCYGYRYENRESIISELKNSFNATGTAIPYVTSGLFGDSATECLEKLSALVDFVGRLNWY